MLTEAQLNAAYDAYIAARAAAHPKRFALAKAFEAAESLRVDTRIPAVCPLCKEPTVSYPNPPFKIAYCALHAEAVPV